MRELFGLDKGEQQLQVAVQGQFRTRVSTPALDIGQCAVRSAYY